MKADSTSGSCTFARTCRRLRLHTDDGAAADANAAAASSDRGRELQSASPRVDRDLFAAAQRRLDLLRVCRQHHRGEQLVIVG